MAKSSRRIDVQMKIPASVKAWIQEQIDAGQYKDMGHCVESLVRESSGASTLRSWADLNELLAKSVRSGPARPMTSRDWTRIRRAGEAGAARRRADDRAPRRSA